MRKMKKVWDEIAFFLNDETIPLKFGRAGADAFCTLLRRIGELILSPEMNPLALSRRIF